MPNFTSLLIHSCQIQAKALTLVGFEQVESWSTVATVPCRHDYERSARISGGGIGGVRENTDNDIFFLNSDATISEGNRIVHDGKNYQVLTVSKMYDSSALHHLEVIARLTTHD